MKRIISRFYFIVNKEKNNKNTFDLFLISVIVILFELIAIRWIGSNIKVVAYFTNLILISAFLGLGWGYILGQRAATLRYYFPLIILIFVLGVLALAQFNLISVDPSHHLHIYTYANLPVEKKINFFTVISLVFILNTAAFIPLGQVVGQCFARFERPLIAYSINMAGNIIGVIIFIALFFFWTAPTIWFLVLFAIFLWFLKKRKWTLLYSLPIFAFCLYVLAPQQGAKVEHWSPYYHVTLEPLVSTPQEQGIGFVLKVDGERHQDSLDFGAPAYESSWYNWWSDFYSTPYRFAQPKKVLILGAGSGNDTYFALQHGVEEIHAVEIDPAIIEIGRRHHPKAPYAQADRVTVHNDDARSFLANTNERFDMIVFGVLDSQKLSSYVAVGLRLDTFIYTKECYALARKRLRKDGILVLQHGGQPWTVGRIYNALEEAFGTSPSVYSITSAPWPILHYVVSAGRTPRPDSMRDLTLYPNFGKFARDFDTLTDNWPFLYLQSRKIPTSYLHVILFVIGFSALGLFITLFPRYRSHMPPRDYAVHFFLMGTAFLLLETVSISRASMLFGSTWLVTSVIIIIVLIYILLANLFVIKMPPISLKLAYGLLFASLVTCYFFPIQLFLQLSLLPRLLTGSLLLSLPVLFAAVVFAMTFKVQRNSEVILGINLFGAVVGGLLEYTDLIIGFQNLYLLSLCLYLGSYLTLMKGKRLSLGAGSAPGAQKAPQ